jgi:hypothetical protein
MPNAYAYIRVSHAEQVESGLSLTAQEQDCRNYWANRLQPKGVEWARLIADEAVSAFKHPLATRKGGRELIGSLHRGDHVIMTRFDRAFRNMRDFLNTYTQLQPPAGPNTSDDQSRGETPSKGGRHSYDGSHYAPRLCRNAKMVSDSFAFMVRGGAGPNCRRGERPGWIPDATNEPPFEDIFRPRNATWRVR